MINEEKIFYDSTDGIRLCGLLSVMNKSKNIVVLLHGLNGNKEEMNCFNVAVQQLQNKRINSFRFDFRAHGESTGIDYEMTPTKEVEDLEVTLNMLSKKGFENIVLWSSMCVLALSIIAIFLRAIIGPRVTDRIICINMIGTKIIIMICIVAALLKESFIIDVAIVYALINFVSIIVLSYAYLHVYKKNREEKEGK